MDEATIIDMTIQSMTLVLVLSLPPIIVASVSGVLVSLVQALTQVQEQTLSFAVKLLAVFATLVLTARWVGAELILFGTKMFETFPYAVK